MNAPVISVEQADQAQIVRLHGEIDIASVGALGGPLGEHLASTEATVLDLGETGFLDSAGVRLLLMNIADVVGRGGRIAVSCPRRSRVRRVLDVSGFGELAPVSDSVADALASFA